VVVDLRGNGFGNAGAAALATALKQHANEHLTELDIGYNEIKDDGACAIAQVRWHGRCWILTPTHGFTQHDCRHKQKFVILS